MTWYNTDGSPATTIPVKVGSILYATGNVSLLAGRFNRPDVNPVVSEIIGYWFWRLTVCLFAFIQNYRLVQTTSVFN